MVALPEITPIKFDKAKQKADRLIEQIWPDAAAADVWNRKTSDGYMSTPRTMPLIVSMINDLTKGTPAGFAYLGLWARSVNESVVEIKDPGAMAYEIGFVGERRAAAWSARIALLEKLGFIKCSDGAAGKYSFILLMNPYHVIQRLAEQKHVQKRAFNVFLSRALEIGAKELTRNQAATEKQSKPKIKAVSGKKSGRP